MKNHLSVTNLLSFLGGEDGSPELVFRGAPHGGLLGPVWRPIREECFSNGKTNDDGRSTYRCRYSKYTIDVSRVHFHFNSNIHGDYRYSKYIVEISRCIGYMFIQRF